MPRTQEETRLLIADTLDALLASRPISKIKVATICDEAAISRTAFYRYFDSVEDVPKWLWERIFSETAGRIGHGLTLYEGHLELYQRLEKRRNFFCQSLRDERTGGTAALINRSTLDDVVERAIRNGEIHPTDAELLQVRFFNEGAVALTRAWLTGELDCSPEAMSSCLMAMVPAFWKKYAHVADASR